ncbi:hypothetical protein BX070DRAFT_220169 [Coemansia spiralis]|nr:hypothetical protein BX070DRAFT_220169 [Coemansia spiralis]
MMGILSFLCSASRFFLFYYKVRSWLFFSLLNILLSYIVINTTIATNPESCNNTGVSFEDASLTRTQNYNSKAMDVCIPFDNNFRRYTSKTI